MHSINRLKGGNYYNYGTGGFLYLSFFSLIIFLIYETDKLVKIKKERKLNKSETYLLIFLLITIILLIILVSGFSIAYLYYNSN